MKMIVNINNTSIIIKHTANDDNHNNPPSPGLLRIRGADPERRAAACGARADHPEFGGKS